MGLLKITPTVPLINYFQIIRSSSHIYKIYKSWYQLDMAAAQADAGLLINISIKCNSKISHIKTARVGFPFQN